MTRAAPAKPRRGSTKVAWRTVRFDEIAENIGDRVDPAESNAERYVGLEHLDSDSLKIRRWGTPDEVIGQKLAFRKGDIIFGRRRAYQRKLAVADFDGICSAHAMVVRAKEDAVDKDFLPFFMQSDMFMERAQEISVGSLSPTINWKTLRVQEFPLPPKDEQRRIAAILSAADTAIDAYRESHQAIETLFFAVARDVFASECTPSHWSWSRLSDIARVERGKFAHRPRNLPRFYGGPYPFAQTGDVARSSGYITEFEDNLSEEGMSLSRSFPKHTILITIAAVIGATAVTPYEVWCTDSVVGIVPNDGIDVWYLEAFLRTLRPVLENKVATQTAQKNINLQKLRPIRVPIPPEAEQRSIAHMFNSIRSQRDQLANHLKRLQDAGAAVREQLCTRDCYVR